MNNYSNQNKIRSMVLIAILVAQGMVLSYVERFIPMSLIVPGARLGLANIITLTALCILPTRDALWVVILRTFLSAITFGSLSSFLYSISGGLLSFIMMNLFLKIKNENLSLVGISIIGATFHNIGQLAVAGIIINNIRMISYLPLLLIVAIPTGIFVGYVTQYLVGYLEKTSSFSKLKNIK